VKLDAAVRTADAIPERLGNGEVIELSGWRGAGCASVTSLLDRGVPRTGRRRALAWPIGTCCTKDRLSDAQGTQPAAGGLRALVEQASPTRPTLGRCATGGLLYRVREVFRAAGALVCFGRWLDRVPT
jgi:hypothetical protein